MLPPAGRAPFQLTLFTKLKAHPFGCAQSDRQGIRTDPLPAKRIIFSDQFKIISCVLRSFVSAPL